MHAKQSIRPYIKPYFKKPQKKHCRIQGRRPIDLPWLDGLGEDDGQSSKLPKCQSVRVALLDKDSPSSGRAQHRRAAFKTSGLKQRVMFSMSGLLALGGVDLPVDMPGPLLLLRALWRFVLVGIFGGYAAITNSLSAISKTFEICTYVCCVFNLQVFFLPSGNRFNM
ncbi:hypothetical protein HPP92_028028 [Vanilla planifolia]|uniref:Uncharacterized protein n=1 Tax=Vanilla planifolia TaxID=51239 RepID=A0A835P9G1_VANPL|nr:hypothetical protein HPP92_028028 [Vanilla planifolia]